MSNVSRHNEYKNNGIRFINDSGDGTDGIQGLAVGTIASNSDGDLDGAYFSENCYRITYAAEVPGEGGHYGCIAQCKVADTADPSYNSAPKSDLTARFIQPTSGTSAYINISEDGIITTTRVSSSGFKEYYH